MPVASPQIVNQPFVTLTAKDAGTTVSNFVVRLEALGMPTPVTRFADDFEDGDFNGWVAGSGQYLRAVTSDTAARGSSSLTLLGGANEVRSGLSHTLQFITPDEVHFANRSSRTDAFGGYVSLGTSTNDSSIAVHLPGNDGTMNLHENSGGLHKVPHVAKSLV
jgi:hypothetical protein